MLTTTATLSPRRVFLERRPNLFDQRNHLILNHVAIPRFTKGPPRFAEHKSTNVRSGSQARGCVHQLRSARSAWSASRQFSRPFPEVLLVPANSRKTVFDRRPAKRRGTRTAGAVRSPQTPMSGQLCSSIRGCRRFEGRGTAAISG